MWRGECGAFDPEIWASPTQDRRGVQGFAPQLYFLGFGHRACGSVHEQLRCDDRGLAQFLMTNARADEELLILSTCERFEVYSACQASPNRRLLHGLSEHFGLGIENLESGQRTLTGTAVARQLLRVAAGLESRIEGETQILGQVRRAFLGASACGTVGPLLSSLARAAIHAGRRVRRETPLNSEARSSATLAADRVWEELPTGGREPVLILGTGVLARDVALALQDKGARRFIFASRRLERAEAIARRFGGTGIPLEQLSRAAAECAALVACSTTRDFLINPDSVPVRPKAMLLIDLGVPRNVDPRIGSLPWVKLSTLADLTTGGNLGTAGVDEAKHIVEEELSRFQVWMGGRRAAPAIVNLLLRHTPWEPGHSSASRVRLHRQIMGLKEMALA